MLNMPPPNFRVKLNLSSLYNDARRSCWIFVDGSKMLQIGHMQKHIAKLFNVRQPFHLLLRNKVYLHPDEDIRIVKEDETIFLIPGTGLRNEYSTVKDIALQVDDAVGLKEAENINVKWQENGNITLESMKACALKRLEMMESPVKHDELAASSLQPLAIRVQEMLSNKRRLESQNGSLNALTVPQEAQDKSNLNGIPELTTTDGSLIDDSNVMDSPFQCPQKKRVRRRKKKSGSKSKEVDGEENPNKKPKIIDFTMIASGKHIRFDNLDQTQLTEDRVDKRDTSVDSTKNTKSPPHELANLLSLGQSSPPRTFANRKLEEELKEEDSTTNHKQTNVLTKCNNGSIGTHMKSVDREELLNKDFQKEYPVMTGKPQQGDILAFKMLKIASDYTPQVSEFIVAEVISCSPDEPLYTLQVLQGLSELQVPVGKFTLVEADGQRELSDIITLCYNDILEPRLLSRSSVNGGTQPVASRAT